MLASVYVIPFMINSKMRLSHAQRAPWVAALFDCVESALAHHKYSWAKTTCDILVKDIIDRRGGRHAIQFIFLEHTRRCDLECMS